MNVLESSQTGIHEQKLRNFLRTLELFGTPTTKIPKSTNERQLETKRKQLYEKETTNVII